MEENCKKTQGIGKKGCMNINGALNGIEGMFELSWFYLGPKIIKFTVSLHLFSYICLKYWGG